MQRYLGTISRLYRNQGQIVFENNQRIRFSRLDLTPPGATFDLIPNLTQVYFSIERGRAVRIFLLPNQGAVLDAVQN